MSRPRKFQPVNLSSSSKTGIENMTEDQLHEEIRRLGHVPNQRYCAFYDETYSYNNEGEVVDAIPMSEEQCREADRKAHEVSMTSWRNQIHRANLEKTLWPMPDKDLWTIVQEWESKVFPWRECRDFTPSAKRQTTRVELIRRCMDAIHAQSDHPLNSKRTK